MTDTRKFFDALCTGKPDGATVVLWVKGLDDSKRTTYALSADSAERDALNATGDVYVGVGYAAPGAGKELGPKRRPGKQHVHGIVGLWADIDVNGGPEHKKNAAPDKAAAAELAAALLEPSMLVDSGYGIQAWWLFEEPWIFDTGEDRAGAQELEAKWLKALAEKCDYKLDATHDLSRVLRVPGTVNHKGGDSAPVKLVEFNDARYTLEDFGTRVEHVQLTLGSAAAPADDIIVRIDPKAAPPFDKFEALKENDDDFATAWARDRRGDKYEAWSASEWDMSLADRAVRARWTDQEITDLLVAARVKHGDDLKRADYYARTIARVRATVHTSEREVARENAIAELEAPPVTADDFDPAKVLAHFEQVVGVKLTAFKQYGRDPDEGGTFELVLGGDHAGRRIRFPNFDELANPMKFRSRIATATSKLMPRVKAGRWDKVIERMLSIVEVHDSPGETAQGVLAEQLDVYVAVNRAQDRNEALRSGYPHEHEHDGVRKLYVHRGHLQHFLRTRFGERVNRRDLTATLKAAGFMRETVGFRKVDGSSTTVSLYARPLGANGNEPADGEPE